MKPASFLKCYRNDEVEYQPGQLLWGKYELVRPLAEGGMGVVWIAHNYVLDIDVAIKLTPNHGSQTAKCSRERALSEARLAAQLAHPAVCRVLDFGLTDRGDPCVVSELLSGETLAARIAAEGPMAPTEAVRVVLPILDALAVAHDKGIVHRDIKPSNIFMACDALNRLQPKLLDFGIAKARNQRVPWAVAGTISGTPAYMSPEQANGHEDLIDLRTDIWSTCATLCELLTGIPPFKGETCAAILRSVRLADPAPIPLDREVDRRLWKIVMRGLQKDPGDRWASAGELSAELASWLFAQGVEADLCGYSLDPRVRGFIAPPTLIGRRQAMDDPVDEAWRASRTRRIEPNRLRFDLHRHPRGFGLAAGGILFAGAALSVLCAGISSSEARTAAEAAAGGATAGGLAASVPPTGEPRRHRWSHSAETGAPLKSEPSARFGSRDAPTPQEAVAANRTRGKSARILPHLSRQPAVAPSLAQAPKVAWLQAKALPEPSAKPPQGSRRPNALSYDSGF